MATTQRRKRTGRRGGREQSHSRGDKQRTEELRRGFAKFRRTRKPGARIPNALREAVLAALESGEAEGEVRRVCGVTSTQLAQWGHRKRSSAKQGSLGDHKARVFSVVDEMPEMKVERRSGGSEATVELRLGGWEICLRQLEA